MPLPKNSLQAVLERQARVEPALPPDEPASRLTASAPKQATGKFFRPSREGQKLIAGHFAPRIAKQLKLLAAEEETTVQALLEEALDLLFVKKGKGTIQKAS